MGAVDRIVVAAPSGWCQSATATLWGSAVPVTVVVGAATRQGSVRAALAVLPPEVDVVLVHDAARPLIPPAVVEAVLAAVRAGAAAAVPVLPVIDTLKSVDATGTVVGTVDRSMLAAVQTPQGFRREVLEQAHRQASSAALTDDAGLVEALGIAVRTVPGDPAGFKITTPYDVVLAEALLGRRR